MASPLNDSEYLYGFHDPGGEHIMLEKGIPGWVLVTEALGYEPNDQSGRNYRFLSDRGLGVMVRLNAGYGGVGTIPFSRFYDDFAQRCANFVRNSDGCHIWIIGNEMNHPIEWPGADWDFNAVPPRPRSQDKTGEKITPELYVRCYRKVRDAIRAIPGRENDQVIIGAVAPWNNLTTYPGNPTGDWIQYFQDILRLLGPQNCDGIALHTYTHGTHPDLIDAPTKMRPPFQNRHYHFRAYQDFMHAIPADMRHLPVYITETDQNDPWRNENTGWVRRAYGEIDYWNKNNPQQIRALILYRWPKLDKWYIEGKQGVIDDFRMALDWKLKWRRDVIIPPVAAPDYRAMIDIQQAPVEGPAGADVTVIVTVRNTGALPWPAGGRNPVRLGYHWYDQAGGRVAAADYRTRLPKDVQPGEQVTLRARVGLPGRPGDFVLALDMVHEGITWFADQGGAPARIEIKVVGEPVVIEPEEQFFPETKIWVRGVFLQFYRRYGLDICGYPITEAFEENGMQVQYFQRVALEEYEPGKVRLRLTAQQALEAAKRIAALERRIRALEQGRLTGMAPRPEITDITERLPRDPAGMFTRPETDIEYIVINHTAVRPEVPVERIARAHRRTWPAIVSQFYIQGDGAILQTNPLDEVVDDRRPWLRNAINIHVAGNFSAGVPNEAQLDALAALCAWLLDRYGLDTEAVKGAKEFYSTQSPGNNWLDGPRWKDMLIQRIEPLRGSGEPPSPEGAEDEALRQELEQMTQARDRLAQLLQQANARIEELQEQVSELQQSLREITGGGVAEPRVRDVITDLPRDPSKMIRRSDEDIKFIVINHTAVPRSVGVQRVARAHRARWPAIVSQFFIDGEGAILQTNPLNEVVDDKQPWILNGVNIHVAGNFNDEIPTEAQLESLADLIAWLLEKYDLDEESVKGVREFIVTQSPGEQWQKGRKWKNTLLKKVRERRVQSKPLPGGVTDAVKLRALERQVRSLAEKNERYLQEIKALKTQAKQLEKDLKARNAQMTRLEKENEKLKKQLEAAQKEGEQGEVVASLQKRIRALEKERDALAGERDQLSQTASELQRRVEEQQLQIDELRRQLDARTEEAPPAPGGVSKPPMQELVDKLPKHPTKRYDSRPLSQITHIAIHHSAAPANVPPERIANYHVNHPSHQWPGIGYHYYIGPDGTIYHTQDLKLASWHVYKNNSYTVGVCVAGNFTDVIPTPAQIDAAARLVSWLMQELNIPLDNVWGHKEFPYNATSCPGRQWVEDKAWRNLLMERIQAVLGGDAGPASKSIYHYMLFWHHGDNWAKQDWEGAENYIARFQPTVGFSVEEAKQAEYVTIVGGPAGVSPQVDDELRAAGVKVERLAGKDFADTKAILDRLAESGQRFLNF